MIAPQSMQDGASPWVAKATFTFPSDIVIGDPPFPFVDLPFPFATCPLACPFEAMTLNSDGAPASAAPTPVATAAGLGLILRRGLSAGGRSGLRFRGW